jgi:hypothetical protein
MRLTHAALAAVLVSACSGSGTVGVPLMSNYDTPPPAEDQPPNAYQPPGGNDSLPDGSTSCGPCSGLIECSGLGGSQELELGVVNGFCLLGQPGSLLEGSVLLACGGLVISAQNETVGTWVRGGGGYQLCDTENLGGEECVTCESIEGGVPEASVMIEPVPGGQATDAH